MEHPAEQPAAERPAVERPHVPIGLVFRLGVPVVVIVAVVLLIGGSHKTRTVSEVIDDIHTVALAKPDGGLIGPWWVSAVTYDPQTNRLRDFKIECEPLHIAARSARVVVNHHTDSVQFEMWEVVIARVDDNDEEAEHQLLDVDRYMLGPIRWRIDIVADPSAPLY